MTLHKLLCCTNGLLPGGERSPWSLCQQDSAKGCHIFSFQKSLLWRNVPLKKKKNKTDLLLDQLKCRNSVCAHLQEQSLGGDVSVSLALLWLVEAAHPTRLRGFLWASGGRSCQCAQVSNYTHALSLQKPPLLLINDTLKESHSHTPLPAHRNFKEP